MPKQSWQTYQTARRSRVRLGAEVGAVEPAEVMALRRATLALIGGLPDHRLAVQGHEALGYLQAHAGLLGIAEAAGELDADDLSARERTAVIRALLAATPLPRRRPPASALLRKLEWLGDTLALAPLECELLALFARTAHSRAWRKLLEAAASGGGRFQVDGLAMLCGVAPNLVERCLMPGAPLIRSGLIVDERDGDYRLGPFVERLRGLVAVEPDMLARHMLPPAPASTLDWENFAHLASARDLAEAAIRGAAGGAGGLNLLLHGLPGTGKSEFARAIAERCGLTAIFAGLSDDDGGEPDRSERLAHFAVLRALTERSGAHLIVVDEADDLLSLDGEGRARRSKLWVNRLVEEVHTPTIWIINHPAALGATAVRRMHLAIGFDLPPPAVRERVLLRAGQGAALPLSVGEVARVAQLPAAPAVLANAVVVARLAGEGAKAVEQATNGILEALGVAPTRLAPLPAAYDPALAQADQDLAALADRLAASPARDWSLLLGGPSGTGKSAFARHLAGRLGLELIEQRGSDLLDAFVGGTEAKIARAFREAAERGGGSAADRRGRELPVRSSPGDAQPGREHGERAAALDGAPPRAVRGDDQSGRHAGPRDAAPLHACHPFPAAVAGTRRVAVCGDVRHRAAGRTAAARRDHARRR